MWPTDQTSNNAVIHNTLGSAYLHKVWKIANQIKKQAETRLNIQLSQIFTTFATNAAQDIKFNRGYIQQVSLLKLKIYLSIDRYLILK